MKLSAIGRVLLVIAILFGAGLFAKYLLPVLLPFFVGGLLAVAAEPVVRFSRRRLGLPRGAAAGLGVSVTLLLLLTAVTFAGAFAVKELKTLAAAVPDLAQTAQQGLGVLETFLVRAADRSPESVRPMLTRLVHDTFDGSGVIVTRLTGRIPEAVGSVLGKVPDGALGVGTGLLAAFMISARLPGLREMLRRHVPVSWREKWLPAWQQVRGALGGWLRAQLKLMGMTFCIVTLGLVLLRVPYAVLWALLVSAVDAVPVLGTGTVLLPWALIRLLQGAPGEAAGLVGIYGAAFLARSVLEPRFVGKQLGIDPLVTLVALYAGYRFWGLPGMLLAPVLTTAVKAVAEAGHS